MMPFLGIFVFLVFALLLSEAPRSIQPKFVAKALLLQFAIGYLFLKAPGVSVILEPLNLGVSVLQQVTDEATAYIFGYVGGGASPFEVVKPENNFIIAFRVLPLILVIGAFSAVLFHWGVLPAIVRLMAFVLRKTIGISGPLGLGSASSVFFGTIETPLFIRPYLDKLTRSELFGLISCSMATVAGTVMVLYASVLQPIVSNPTTHLLTASLISVPAALLLAHVFVPPKQDESNSQPAAVMKSPYDSTFGALTTGISEGLAMVFNIVGIILVFFAFVYLVNRGLGALSEGLTLQGVLGTVLKPLVILIGIPVAESAKAAELMGIKIVLNEFVAYLELAKTTTDLSESSRLIMTYALCGFANFASAGIIIGGLSALMPARKAEISSLTFKSLISGNLACLMTGAVVAILKF